MIHYVQHGLAARVQKATIGAPKWDLNSNLYVSEVTAELVPLEGKKPQKLCLAFKTSGTENPNDDLEATLQQAFAQGAEVIVSGIQKDGTRLTPTATKPNHDTPIVKVTLQDVSGPKEFAFFR
ncbi:MAG: hypothetical protein WC043_02350 [Pseudobdellovibrionaceae bacterium]